MSGIEQSLRCDACDSQKIKEWLPGFVHHYQQDGVDKAWPYRFVECQSCGLGFIDPMPDWKLLQTFYPADYHCYGENSYLDSQYENRKYKIARFRFAGSVCGIKNPAAVGRRGLAMVTEWLSGKTISYSLGIPLQLPRDANVFEIGYGSGYWLQMMSSLGYKNLYGYDIDANPASLAKLRGLGVILSAGAFLTNDYPEDHFDCIRLEHVFEHLLTPVEVLGKCWKMLKPNGNLVMTFPCKSSWSRTISSRHWGPLEPPVHIYHHTPSSVTSLFKKIAFELKDVRTFSVADQLVSTINNVVVAHGKKSPFGTLVSRAIAPAYRAFGALTSRGDFMTVWGQRPGAMRL